MVFDVRIKKKGMRWASDVYIHKFVRSRDRTRAGGVVWVIGDDDDDDDDKEHHYYIFSITILPMLHFAVTSLDISSKYKLVEKLRKIL